MDEYVNKSAVQQMLHEAYADDVLSTKDGCKALYKRLDDIPAAGVQPIGRWISVKDRLPDESCECLGVVDGEVTEVSYSPKQKGLICVWSMCDADGFKPLLDDAVTHWMPFPEPPQD